MPELGLYGSVRGARGNSRPYRERFEHAPVISDLPLTPDISLQHSNRRFGPKAPPEIDLLTGSARLLRARHEMSRSS
jgi:hypothetical protein